jgi:hypothetical protein
MRPPTRLKLNERQARQHRTQEKECAPPDPFTLARGRRGGSGGFRLNVHESLDGGSEHRFKGR